MLRYERLREDVEVRENERSNSAVESLLCCKMLKS
jgi:hypothetical protein